MAHRIAILGSTGSIGTQSLDIISRYPGEFEVEALVAGNNVDLLTRQAKQFNPRVVVIGNEKGYKTLKENLRDIYADLSTGKIPYARRYGELAVG